MDIEFFKPEDLSNLISGIKFGGYDTQAVSKWISINLTSNLPQLYEALGMQKFTVKDGDSFGYDDTFFKEVNLDDQASFMRIGARVKSDTHYFYMTSPQPIKVEEVECDHLTHSLFQLDLMEGDNWGKWGKLQNTFCPKCGQKLDKEGGE